MKITSLLCLCIFCFFSLGCGVAKSFGPQSEYGPRAADAMAADMDAQLMRRAGIHRGSLSEEQAAARAHQIRRDITIVTTVPVNVNNLKLSNALARQMMEEASRWFVSAGYNVQEIRKGKELRFQEQTGEMLLTRKRSELARTSASGTAVLTGTYVISPEQVRFSMRLVHTLTNDVLAMGTATVPITPDVPPLLVENSSDRRVQPSVYTRLQ